MPANPLGWLVRVASRRLVDQHRRDQARRRREEAVVAAGPPDGESEPVAGADDSLLLLFMCCHPSLPPSSAIPLTLRAVGGLTTTQIAAAFLVPEATMARRISRAKARVRDAGATFDPPTEVERSERLGSVLHVLYLMFNEGYATSSGPDLARPDLSGEAIRLTRVVHERLPAEPEVAGLLALMLFTDARRPARTGPGGELVPLAEQDRSSWDGRLMAEGYALLAEAIGRGDVGTYQLEASIAGLHDEAPTYASTDWVRIEALYRLLERRTANPMVHLNRAIAVGMAGDPDLGLTMLDAMGDDLAGHHRRHAARAHLLEMVGRREEAVSELRLAASRTANQREQQHLVLRAARLAHDPPT